MSKHPKGLPLLFTTEMWERFSFYTIQALVVLYATTSFADGGLGWTQAHAVTLVGTYTAIAYMTPILGGFLADRVLGQRRSVMFGGTLMAIGHFLMAFHYEWAFYSALVFIALGNGFFKPCLTSILGELYDKDDPHRDNGYNIFYLGINIGAFFSGIIGGWLQEEYGFDWAFAAAGVGMLVGLALFLWRQNAVLGDVGLRPSPQEKSEKTPWTRAEKKHAWTLGILCFFVIFFMVGYSQSAGTLTLYAENNTNRVIWTPWESQWNIPTAWFYSLNPVFIMLLTPILVRLWSRLDEKDLCPHPVTKMVFGFAAYIISVFVMVEASKHLSVTNEFKTSPWWLVGFYFFLTAAELLIVPVVWSCISRYAPKNNVSLFMSLGLLCIGIGSYLAGQIGSHMQDWGVEQVFEFTGWISLAGGGLLVLMRRFLIQMLEVEKKALCPTGSPAETGNALPSNS